MEKPELKFLDANNGPGDRLGDFRQRRPVGEGFRVRYAKEFPRR